VLAVLLTACRSAQPTNALGPQSADRTSEFLAVRERMDRLTRRIDELSEQQAKRLVALELRSSQLETRQTQAEQTAEDVKAVHAELAKLRQDVVALGAEEELDRMYRERLDRLERVVVATERAAGSPESIDDIWSWYSAQRDEIQHLAQQLNPTRPRP
jgi:septation ring formation regulator EzrA